MTAVIYARYSSDSQREASIEGQLRDCKDYAEKNGITVVGTYIDRAYSAKTDDRPEFQHMIKDSAKKIFDVVLVWKLDRFRRKDSAGCRFPPGKDRICGYASSSHSRNRLFHWERADRFPQRWHTHVQKPECQSREWE